jgi:opacity protein-like surface antigen
MIRFAVATIGLTALIGSFAWAQDATPKVQVFGGFSFVHAPTGRLNGETFDVDLREPSNAFGVETNFQGWNAEAQYNFDRWVGIAADFAGRYGAQVKASSVSTGSGFPSGNAYSILAGPVISYRTRSRVTPFAHLLFGWDRTSLSASTITGLATPVPVTATNYSDFAIALGVGVDYRLFRHVGLRVGQLDYYHTSLNLNKFYNNAFDSDQFQGLSTRQRNLRFSTGLVAQF